MNMNNYDLQLKTFNLKHSIPSQKFPHFHPFLSFQLNFFCFIIAISAGYAQVAFVVAHDSAWFLFCVADNRTAPEYFQYLIAEPGKGTWIGR